MFQNNILNIQREMEEAKNALSAAIRYERRQMWRKAANSYKHLISALREVSLNSDSIDVNALRMLIYESHMHYGVACQNLTQTKEAIKHFASAMRAVSRKKVGCRAGCITGNVLHLHVPALAKMSTCHLQQGDYELALRHIEEALVLDFKNPDLFCIRACAFFLLKYNEKAMKDVNYSIWLNTRQACGWLLRGIFKNISKNEVSLCESRSNADFVTACNNDIHALAYTNTTDLAAVASQLLNRLLPSLRVSHTVSIDSVFLPCSKRNNYVSKRSATCSQRSISSSGCAFVCGNARPLRTPTRSSRLASFTTMPHSSASFHITSTPFPNGYRSKTRCGAQSAPSRCSTRVSGVKLTFGNLLDTEVHYNKEKSSGATEQERQYPRAWTQNKIPVKIPDIRGCRTISNEDRSLK
ncbi:uncharacterized protein LOC116621574 isoform X2 [Nematostella vectensis]|uniref:uncharacterized protein LOC116621574 isoform X2 n=1 Tax=Nematostella vectensis TaxID=45351 RepID=UPI0020771461|nr:uncharacterized protein LOC116621574 isoform X2 [Nematostella vectensis]